MNELVKEAPIKEEKIHPIKYNKCDDNLLISWIIIGRNWLETSDLLVDSLNKQDFNSKLIELIIIDDCSNDKSVKLLEKINYKNKKIIMLNKQSGRSYARNQGIKLASGKFCLFTNSNTIPTSNFLNQYTEFLSETDADGVGGVIHYSSSDTTFEKYLNNNKRGLRKFQQMEVIPIEYILFGNCAIKTTLLKKINGFNEKLIGYGGEEIEMLSRMEHLRNLLFIKIDPTVVRVQHPSLNKHCYRLLQFGKTNFKLLPNEIQNKIIPKSILRFYKFLPTSIMLLKFKILNKIFMGKNFLLIKCILGLSLLKGYKK